MLRFNIIYSFAVNFQVLHVETTPYFPLRSTTANTLFILYTVCTFTCVKMICLYQILRKYGTPKPNKNKYSKAGKEQHQGKVVSTKRPITKPPTKEKSVLNSVR